MEFIIGFILGGTLGTLIMALIAGGKHGDK